MNVQEALAAHRASRTFPCAGLRGRSIVRVKPVEGKATFSPRPGVEIPRGKPLAEWVRTLEHQFGSRTPQIPNDFTGEMVTLDLSAALRQYGPDAVVQVVHSFEPEDASDPAYQAAIKQPLFRRPAAEAAVAARP